MPDRFRPRDRDHLVEPLFGGLGHPARPQAAPPAPAPPHPRPWAWWGAGILGLAGVGLWVLWWI